MKQKNKDYLLIAGIIFTAISSLSNFLTNSIPTFDAVTLSRIVIIEAVAILLIFAYSVMTK